MNPQLDPIKQTEALYKVKLPTEYRAFLTNKTYQKHSGHFSNLLEGGRHTQAIRFFVGATLWDGPDYSRKEDFCFGNLDELRDTDPELAPFVIPFAAFVPGGDVDSGALAIHVELEEDGMCPVFYYGDGELTQVADSIAEFLASLSQEVPELEDDLDEESDDDDDTPKPGMSERERRIQAAVRGPTTHVFSDYDNTEQGGKAIALGIKNRQGGRASYDYTKMPSADFKWPDLDPARIGHLEPWLVYPADKDGGWIDLNAIASGKERRGAAAYQTLGFTKHPKIQKIDDAAFHEIDRLLKLDDATLAKEAPALDIKSDKLYSPRDYLVGMKRDMEKILAKSNKRAQAGLDVANQIAKEEMDQHVAAAKSGGLLDPVSGITLEDWAAANAKIAQSTPIEQILSVLKVEKPTWDAASAEWMARMSRDSTFAIAKVYGDAFTNPNIGKFAGVKAPKGADSSPEKAGAVQKVKDDFELWVKIMCHQNAAASSGTDVSSVLAKYGLTAADWGTIGGHWSEKINKDFTYATKMGDLMAKFNQEFATAKAGDDIQF